ncbi:MAG TPA: hemerythrin domain-containing protein [Usitatibacter sp.]
MRTTSERRVPPARDVRHQLRRDHERVLAELEALRREGDDRRCQAMLRVVRRKWMIHTLARESVVYRALEGVEAGNEPGSGAGLRFAEHERIGSLFEKLARTRSCTGEWRVSLAVARGLIERRIAVEQEALIPQLAQRLDEAQLAEMGRQFESVCTKLTVLEEAKAA